MKVKAKIYHAASLLRFGTSEPLYDFGTVGFLIGFHDQEL
jgi:hypothetical protein